MAVIHGNKPSQYVDRDSIMVDEPSDKLVNKLVEIDETEISEYFENCKNVLTTRLWGREGAVGHHLVIRRPDIPPDPPDI